MSKRREFSVNKPLPNEPLYVREQRRQLLEVIETLVVSCRGCGAAVSKAMLRWPLGAITLDASGVAAIPQGFFWVAPSMFEPDAGVNSGMIVVSLDDQTHMRASGNRTGCCGVDGLDGLNLSCECGVAIGTETSDCWTPHMLTLSRDTVEVRDCTAEERLTLPSVVWLRGDMITSEDMLILALHEAAGVEEWFGDDLGSLVKAWRARVSTPTLVVWKHATKSREYGVDIERVVTLFSEDNSPAPPPLPRTSRSTRAPALTPTLTLVLDE